MSKNENSPPTHITQTEVIDNILAVKLDISKIKRIHELARSFLYDKNRIFALYTNSPIINTKDAFKSIKNSDITTIDYDISVLFASVPNHRGDIGTIKIACFILVNASACDSTKNTLKKIKLSNEHRIKIINLLSLNGLLRMQQIIQSFDYNMKLSDNEQFEIRKIQLEQITKPDSSYNTMRARTKNEVITRSNPLVEREMRDILSLLNVHKILKLLSECRTMYTRKKPIYYQGNLDENQLCVI